MIVIKIRNTRGLSQLNNNKKKCFNQYHRRTDVVGGGGNVGATPTHWSQVSGYRYFPGEKEGTPVSGPRSLLRRYPSLWSQTPSGDRGTLVSGCRSPPVGGGTLSWSSLGYPLLPPGGDLGPETRHDPLPWIVSRQDQAPSSSLLPRRCFNQCSALNELVSVLFLGGVSISLHPLTYNVWTFCTTTNSVGTDQ